MYLFLKLFILLFNYLFFFQPFVLNQFSCFHSLQICRRSKVRERGKLSPYLSMGGHRVIVSWWAHVQSGTHGIRWECQPLAEIQHTNTHTHAHTQTHTHTHTHAETHKHIPHTPSCTHEVPW